MIPGFGRSEVVMKFTQIIRHSMLLNSNTFKSCGKYIIIHNQLKITIFMVGISTGFPTKNMNNIWPNKLLIAMAANHFTWGTFPSSLASSTFHYSNKNRTSSISPHLPAIFINFWDIFFNHLATNLYSYGPANSYFDGFIVIYIYNIYVYICIYITHYNTEL